MGNEAVKLEDEIETTQETEVIADDATEKVEGDIENEVVLEGESPTPEDGKAKKPNRRIQRLLEKNKQKDAQLTEAEQKLKEMEAQNRILSMKVQPKESASMPTLEQFDYDEVKFNQAMAEFVQTSTLSLVQKEVGNVKKELQTEKQTASLNKTINKFYDKAHELKIANFNENEEAVIDVFGGDVTKSIIANAENDTEAVLLINYLGKNKEKAEEIKELLDANPVKGTFAIAKIAGKLSLKPTNKPAIEPAEELTGGNAPSAQTQWEKKLAAAAKVANKTGDISELSKVRKAAKEAGHNL